MTERVPFANVDAVANSKSGELGRKARIGEPRTT
jgi:hypothetical protein